MLTLNFFIIKKTINLAKESLWKKIVGKSKWKEEINFKEGRIIKREISNEVEINRKRKRKSERHSKKGKLIKDKERWRRKVKEKIGEKSCNWECK
jgi:hypothetical protein